MSAKISPFTSFFLDGLRVVSALGVVLSHLATTKLMPEATSMHAYGHFMVVCFFVLSGFLIKLSVEDREMSLGRYAALRLGRLWSVALPCLALTALLQFLALWWAPGAAQIYSRSFELLRYGGTALFLNEIWFVSAGPAFNSPVWSLAYEAWYYAIFGVAMFIRNPVWKISLVVLTALAMGPKILLLLPVWLIGVALAWVFRRRERLRPVAWPIFGSSVVALVGMAAVHFRWPAPVGYRPWFFSASWGSDFLFGLGVAGLILGVSLLWGSRTPAPWLDGAVRRSAGVSFTLYLLHLPLMCFAASVLPYDRSNGWQVAAIVAGVLVIAYLVGSWIEPQRRSWTARLETLFSAVKPRAREVRAFVFSRAS